MSSQSPIQGPAEADRMSLRAYARSRKARGLPGGTHRAVQRAIESGRIAEAVDDDGLIDPELADRLWAENTRPSLARGAAGTSTPPAGRQAAAEYAAARARLAVARAEREELELAVRKGELVPLEIVEQRYGAFVESVVHAIRRVPARWAPYLCHERPVAEAQAELARLVNELLTELADGRGGEGA